MSPSSTSTPPPFSPAESGGAQGLVVGWAYSTAAALTAASLLALVNPVYGIWFKSWPWSVHAANGWSRESATVFVLGAATLVFAAGAFFAPGRARSLGMLLPVWLSVCFLVNTQIDRNGTIPVKANLFGVAMFVAQLLAGTIAGALWSSLRHGTEGAGRGVAITAAAVLALILVYPQYQPPEQAAYEGAKTYFSPIGDVVGGWLSGETAVLFGERLVSSVLTILYTALAVVGLLASIVRGGKVLPIAGGLLFLAMLAYPTTVEVIRGFEQDEYTPAWRMALQRGAEQTVYLHMASALGLFACTADLLLRRAHEAPPGSGSV